jgi:hypothetical protein
MSIQNKFDPSNPYEWLKRYKTTTTPQECRVCDRTAYYVHPTLGHLCAAHLLDLANVGELNWKWCDWEDVWNMMGRLLGRKSTSATDVRSHVVLRRLAVIAETLAGWKKCSTCKVRKEIEHFSKNKNKIDGYNIVCRTCDNIRRRENKLKRYKR